MGVEGWLELNPTKGGAAALESELRVFHLISVQWSFMLVPENQTKERTSQMVKSICPVTLVSFEKGRASSHKVLYYDVSYSN